MNLDMVAEQADGLSYFSIQKTLVQTLKKSLFDIQSNTTHLSPAINTRLWLKLIEQEKQQQEAILDKLALRLLMGGSMVHGGC